ncbi:hypothetical protein MIZ03_1254 [Rhodoferax lithotrophicus]|uniref:Uncharacterized protein n=1 Tax=Rhodoferax lithotrophicus TaxID=2798804 RepID=A0ABM7MJE9_9BURK|nr:hypothetical protein MIZ03_1254 [Rhodoferax sp. MIZ03]
MGCANVRGGSGRGMETRRLRKAQRVEAGFHTPPAATRAVGVPRF